ncbi:30s ribosomal protein s6 [Lasius niger]|uniref:Small ribosomal subunit protein bS6m n=1 Tax=Lasius niger TaxID=67767 RepID=A0A0J7MW90_LASNI|nr:30s ribosomal protein s6 [Lasius niger]
MALYELTLILRNDLSTTQVETFIEGLEGKLGELGGSVEKKEFWGLRPLAYRIKKNRKGHYVFLGLNTPADALKEIERQMSLDEDMLRFLTLRVDALPEGQTPMMSRRDERPARGGRQGGQPQAGGRFESGRGRRPQGHSQSHASEENDEAQDSEGDNND